MNAIKLCFLGGGAGAQPLCWVRPWRSWQSVCEQQDYLYWDSTLVDISANEGIVKPFGGSTRRHTGKGSIPLMKHIYPTTTATVRRVVLLSFFVHGTIYQQLHGATVLDDVGLYC